MGKVLFVQMQKYAYPGLYYLCGALRDAGHEYKVIHAMTMDETVSTIDDFQPDIVGFSCMTGVHRIILRLCAGIKKNYPEIQTVLGGIHPTLYPNILEDPNVDFICRGDGEAPLVELVDAVARGDTQFPIANIHYKTPKGQIIENAMRPLIDNMDDLPFPDYSIYSDIPEVADDEYPMVYYERGCPYHCSYCHNSDQRALFKGLGKFVRKFSVQRILDEVDAAVQHYPKARAVLLGTDTFAARKDFTHELLTSYKKRFDMPYTVLIRPELVKDEVCALLAQTGCHMVAFGIESGSERVRKELLGRKYTNQRVIEAAQTLRKHGIKFRTYNIVGFPGETREEMLATLELNLKIRPAFPWASIFTPYPRTELADYAIENGYLRDDFTFDDVPLSFFNDTVLTNVDRNFIRNVHAFFQLFVLMPALYPIFKWVLKLPYNPVYGFIFKGVYSLVCIRSENRTVWGFLQLALGNRHMFNRKVKDETKVASLTEM